ncbi:hypothetical protein [Leyella stercorea]|nr:hypothetical protein [Leyella stercorea]
MQKEVLLIASAPTDADVCTDRRGCLHRPMRAMKVLLLISSPSRTVG